MELRDGDRARAVERLARLVKGRRVAVLTGAGCSTESGIPDYRGPDTRSRARNPIQYQEFTGSAEARTRYWARSSAGWQRVASARPNAGHVALAQLESAGVVRGIITQNVDGLHGAAGSRRVVELHGSLSEVSCLQCGAVEARRSLQNRISDLNPGWTYTTADMAPDGDAEVNGNLAHFRVPACHACDGILKPNVVFFGESVPKERVDRAWQLMAECDVLLIAGSSLAVYSGYRFPLRAAREGVPVAIVNLGPTRADAIAAVRINGYTGSVLPELHRLLR